MPDYPYYPDEKFHIYYGSRSISEYIIVSFLNLKLLHNVDNKLMIIDRLAKYKSEGMS